PGRGARRRRRRHPRLPLKDGDSAAAPRGESRGSRIPLAFVGEGCRGCRIATWGEGAAASATSLLWTPDGAVVGRAGDQSVSNKAEFRRRRNTFAAIGRSHGE